jgi:ABC-type phosphate transport system substrate-binding protein
MRVSLPLIAHRGRARAALAALCAVIAVAVAAGSAPPSAHAAFTIAKCGGSAVQGEGSSLQKVAQLNYWIAHVFYSPLGCENAAVTSPVSYEPDGSGCGIAAIGGGPSAEGKCLGIEASKAEPGVRSKVSRFGGSDAPLTEAQKLAAEAAGGPSPGVIHEIPVAAAAVSIVVHFPNGCRLKDPGPVSGLSLNGDTSTGGPNDPAGAGTGDTYAAETLRVHITTEELENIWDDSVQQKWENIVPVADLETDAKAAKPMTPLECGAMPVVRIVRLDGSGTTYNFKAYLGLPKAAPAGLWSTGEVVGDNNKWPILGKVETPVKVVANKCEATNDICTGEKTGGGGVASAVAGTDGSIGYLDLATAREKGFDIEKEKDDHTYWIPLQTINPDTSPSTEGANWVEPTATATAHVNGAVGAAAAHGANCLKADFRNIPAVPASDPTLGDWSKAIATGSKDSITYPVCALTYDFAFDDDAPVFGATSEEQSKARTVKDYLEAVVSPFGQDGLEGYDYGTLPPAVQLVAQNGVKAIDWHKAAGSGGSKEEVKSPPPPVEKSGGGGGTTPPSNAFSIAGAKVKGKSIMLTLVLPGPGQVSIKAVGGGLRVASVVANVSGGNGVVTLSISKAALSKLAKVKGHKIVVKITITFTPTGGTGATQVKTITLTQAPAKKGKHGKHHGKHKGKKK